MTIGTYGMGHIGANDTETSIYKNGNWFFVPCLSETGGIPTRSCLSDKVCGFRLCCHNSTISTSLICKYNMYTSYYDGCYIIFINFDSVS